MRIFTGARDCQLRGRSILTDPHPSEHPMTRRLGLLALVLSAALATACSSATGPETHGCGVTQGAQDKC